MLASVGVVEDQIWVRTLKRLKPLPVGLFLPQDLQQIANAGKPPFLAPCLYCRHNFVLPVATFTITASMPHSIEHQITSLRQAVLLDMALVYRWPNGPTARLG